MTQARADAENRHETARIAFDTTREELVRLQGAPGAGAPTVVRTTELVDLRRTDIVYPQRDITCTPYGPPEVQVVARSDQRPEHSRPG